MKQEMDGPRVVSISGHRTPLDVLASGQVIGDDLEFRSTDDDIAPTVTKSGSVEQLMAPLRQYLDDPRVQELAINRPGELLVETAEHWLSIPCKEMDFQSCRSLALAIATNTNQSISETNPILSATLPTQERVQIVLPPTVEDGLVSYTFRKPSKKIWTLKDFSKQGIFGTPDEEPAMEASLLEPPPKIRRGGVFLHVDSPEEVREHLQKLQPFEVELLKLLWAGEIEAFMHAAVIHRRNLAVSGATGSGKTTFMKGLMQECPRSERLITIEDAREIFLPNHPNRVHLLYSKGGQGVATVTASKLLVSCLRMKPDRILLAEIREAECYDFLRVAASGHPGSITSLHAGTCMEAFEQMGLMIRQSDAGAGLSHSETQRLLRLLLDVVVQYSNVGRRRQVSEIYYRPLCKRGYAS